MIAVKQFLSRRTWMIVLMAALAGALVPAASRAQSSGPTVSVCMTNTVDSQAGLEETACLSGDAEELDVSAWVDCGGNSNGDYTCEGGSVEAVLTGPTGTVLDSGMSGGAVSDSIVPQLNVWYTLSTTYESYYCDVYSDCYNGSGGGVGVSAEVTSDQTTLTVASSGTPSIYGTPVTFTATMFNGQAGTITFYDGGQQIGTGTISGTTATFTTSSLAPGTHFITASWPGNSNYGPITSGTFTQTVEVTTSSGLPVLSNVATPYADLPSRVTIAGQTRAAGTVAYGPIGTPLVLSGWNLGSGGTVTFTPYKDGAVDSNASPVSAAVTLWTNGMLILTVPPGAYSGTIEVTTGGMTSNALPFLMTSGSYSASCPKQVPTQETTPTVASLNPSSGSAGLAVNISGSAFGAVEGQGTVTFNGVIAGVLKWSDTFITAVVPSTMTGPVVVTLENGQTSNNNIIFTVSSSSPPSPSFCN